MKNKFLIAISVIIAMFVTACKDNDVYTSGPQGSDIGVRFAIYNPSVIEADQQTRTFELILLRSDSVAALDVPIAVVTNEDNICTIPSSAHFNAGEGTTAVTVKISDSAPIGQEYNFEIKIDDPELSISNPYLLSGISFYYGKVSVSQWENLGDGEFYDSFTFYSIATVSVQQSTINPNQYRISYPYTVDILTEAEWGDWIGGPTQTNIIYTVTDDGHVTWNKFWYTNTIYDATVSYPIKAYLPSALDASLKPDDALSVVIKDGDNIAYFDLYPYFWIDGLGGFEENEVILAFPGYYVMDF